jgi:hypothetical protein
MKTSTAGPKTSRALGVLAVLAAFAPSAEAQDEPFDPSVCAIDPGGKIIARVPSGLAFALDPKHHPVDLEHPTVGGFPRFHDFTARPDLPEGCPENPVAAGFFAVLDVPGVPSFYRATRETDQQLGEEDISVQVLGGYEPVSIQGIQGGDLRHFHLTKENHGFCTTYQGGLTVCHGCDEDPTKPGYCVLGDPGTSNQGQLGWHAATDIVGPPREGTGPNALPIIFSCRPRWSNGFQECEAHYSLQDGLSVSFRVRVVDILEEEWPERLFALARAAEDVVAERRAPQFDGPDIRR